MFLKDINITSECSCKTLYNFIFSFYILLSRHSDKKWNNQSNSYFNKFKKKVDTRNCDLRSIHGYVPLIGLKYKFIELL